MDVSVIVSTRNRARRLEETLRFYDRVASPARWELLLVDNGSTDDTPDVIAAAVARGTAPIVALREERRGVSSAKNLAIARAGGRIVCFTDDDCYPAPSFIDAWLHVFDRSALDFAGGRITLFDPTDAPMTIKPELQPFLFAPRAYIPPGFIHGANMAYRRAVLDRVGPFDVLFGPGGRYYSGDDTDYFQRASNAGFAGGYRSEPVVAHHHGRKPDETGTISRDYEVCRGAFYAKTLLLNPGCMGRYFWAWARSFPNFLAFLKGVYWAQRRDLGRRVWNVGRGMGMYWLDVATGRARPRG